MTFASWHYHQVQVINMLVEVQDTRFVRDTSSMALINNDSSAREDYRMKVRMMTIQKEEINTIRSELSSVKEDMKEIKQLLTKLIGKGGNG